MAFCGYCGNNIADDARFCPHCGNKVEAPAVADPKPVEEIAVDAEPATTEVESIEVEAEPAAAVEAELQDSPAEALEDETEILEAVEVQEKPADDSNTVILEPDATQVFDYDGSSTQQAYTPIYQPAPMQPAKKKSKKALWITLGIVAVVIIVIIALFAFGVFGSRKASPTQGQSKGGYSYSYTDDNGDSDDNGGSSQKGDSFINTFAGDWACVAVDDGSGIIEISDYEDMIDMSGSDLFSLALNEDGTAEMYVMGENLLEDYDGLILWMESDDGITLYSDYSDEDVLELTYDSSTSRLCLEIDGESVYFEKE